MSQMSDAQFLQKSRAHLAHSCWAHFWAHFWAHSGLTLSEPESELAHFFRSPGVLQFKCFKRETQS